MIEQTRDLPVERNRIWAVLCLLMMSCGCANSMSRPSFLGWNNKPPVFGPEATLTDVVSHLNNQIHQVDGWRSTEASVTASGLMLPPMPTMVAVQKPLDVRCVVSNSLDGQHEVDLGTNDERAWLWVRREEGEPHIKTVSHEQFPALQQHTNLPVEPEWLMQVMGLQTYDVTDLTLERVGHDHETLKLVSHITSPSGHEFRKETLVSAQHGHVIEHDLYSPRGNLMAAAILENYRETPIEGVSLPHRIRFRWPAAKKQVTLSLSNIEVNPTALPSDLFEIPRIGCPVRPLRLAAVPAKHAMPQHTDVQPMVGTQQRLPRPDPAMYSAEGQPAVGMDSSELPDALRAGHATVILDPPAEQAFYAAPEPSGGTGVNPFAEEQEQAQNGWSEPEWARPAGVR